MQFRFGARFRSGSIVVERAWPMRDNHGNQFGKTPALHVRVRNHFFDSESDGAKQMYRDYVEAYRQSRPDDPLTEEEVQHRVEQFLLTHPRVGMRDGRGIFPIDENKENPSASFAPSQVSRCIYTTSNEDGTTDQCENTPLEGDILCAKHSKKEVGV